MTRVIPFTKANIKRRIEAAREAGLDVTGIAADGTLIVGTPGKVQPTKTESHDESEVIL